jgi:hypothetical protein
MCSKHIEAINRNKLKAIVYLVGTIILIYYDEGQQNIKETSPVLKIKIRVVWNDEYLGILISYCRRNILIQFSDFKAALR